MSPNNICLSVCLSIYTNACAKLNPDCIHVDIFLFNRPISSRRHELVSHSKQSRWPTRVPDDFETTQKKSILSSLASFTPTTRNPNLPPPSREPGRGRHRRRRSISHGWPSNIADDGGRGLSSTAPIAYSSACLAPTRDTVSPASSACTQCLLSWCPDPPVCVRGRHSDATNAWADVAASARAGRRGHMANDKE
jgi:hypothetical protein